jgi:hypothetical protein
VTYIFCQCISGLMILQSSLTVPMQQITSAFLFVGSFLHLSTRVHHSGWELERWQNYEHYFVTGLGLTCSSERSAVVPSNVETARIVFIHYSVGLPH